jgi:hypothetical protein
VKCKTNNVKSEEKSEVGSPWNESLRFKCDTLIMFGPYCLKWGVIEPGPPNAITFQKNVQGFENRLLSVIKGEIIKFEGKRLIITLFE